MQDIDKEKYEGGESGAEIAREAMERGKPVRGFNMQRLLPRVVCRVCAVLGLLLAVAAWALFYFYPQPAVVTGCAALGASAVGIASGRGCLRQLAITALVAAVVLVLVYAVFYWGVAYGVNHL